jgi:hypothetical protein
VIDLELDRLPSEHVRLRGCLGNGQSRGRFGVYTGGQEREEQFETFILMRSDGGQVIIKWRGKPVFIRHRTEDEIKEAENTNWESLRDPQPDSDRVKKPEWLVMLGMAI